MIGKEFFERRQRFARAFQFCDLVLQV